MDPAATLSGLELFYDLVHKLNSTLDLNTVLTQVIEQVNHFLNIDATSVSLLDLETKELVIHMTVGKETDPQIGLRLPPYAGIAGWVAHHGEAVLLSDVHEDPRFYPAVDQLTHFTSRSMICVPLIVKDQVVGVIQAINKSKGAFSHADLYFMLTLADLAAMSIENARLYHVEQEARRHAEVLKQIAETMGLALSLECGLGVAMDQFRQVVPCDSLAIFVLGDCSPLRLPWHPGHGFKEDLQDTEYLTVLSGCGFEDMEAILQICIPVAEAVLLEHMRFTRHPITISDTRLDQRYVRLPGSEQVRSWMGVPLLVNGRLIGYVSIDRHQVNEFTLREIGFATAFAQQVAGAIANMRLYGEARDLADDLTILNMVSLTVSTSLDLGTVMNRAIDSLSAFFALSAVAILLLDESGQRLELQAQRGLPPDVIESFRTLSVQEDRISNNVIVSHKTMVVEPFLGEKEKTPEDASKLLKSVCVWVPLLTNEVTLGALMAQDFEKRRFSIQHLSLLESIGKQIGIAIKNAQEYSQLQSAM